jgi:hypothetical protein
MSLKNSIERIERKLGVGEDWNLLWNRYRNIYQKDGRPLHLRVSMPFPPCTVQDREYELVEWVKDIQNGGHELALAKKRLRDPGEFEQRFEGVGIELALILRKFCQYYTSYYAGYLRELCVSSWHGYRVSWLDPVYQSNFRREIGEVNYRKLDLILSRYDKEPGCEIEYNGYGPTVFKLFREAGQRGDDKILHMRKELVEGNSTYYS